MKNRYCEICSAKLKKEWTEKYEKITGKKKYRYICSNQPCRHTGHNFIWIGPLKSNPYTKKPFGFWKKFWYQLNGVHSICRRCGQFFQVRCFLLS
jgi:hypothetical protein